MAAFESLECFECSVCLEPMRAKRPVVLSCLHTFCTPCIKQLYRGQRLSCPTCRSETVVPDGDVNKLPVNRDLIKIIEQLEEINKLPENLRTVEDLCQTCLKKGNQQQSVGMCFQCARKLCQGCIEKHNMTAAFKDHQLFIKAAKLDKDEIICRRHSEDIQYICLECLEAVCVDCAGEQQHSNHMDQIIKFERGISDLRKQNDLQILKYDKQIKQIDSIQRDISSDFVVFNTSKKNLEDLCMTFQTKLTEIEKLLQRINKNEPVLQNANKLIRDKKDNALHEQNLLKTAQEYSDLAFLSKINEFNAENHYLENEVEIRRQTQNYTVPKTVLHGHVAIGDLKSAAAATLTEHQPSKSNEWTQEHEGRTCDEAQLAQGEELIKEQMKENSIICPNPKCGFYFELARGGCTHLTCSKCKKQFCQCCLKDFYTDPRLGLACKHPRNCLFHLRDWDIDQLEKMLEENDVEYENDENPEEKECRIMVTVEDDPGKLFETRCDEKVKRNKNGLCDKHYKEFLVRVINENNLDPVDVMSDKEISILLMREKVEKPPKDQGATLEEYRNELVQFVKEQLPLQQMQGKP